MSDRTYINGTQVFGNNEGYPEWFEFIESQGIEIDEGGNYEGEIKDFMQALVVIENIVLRLSKEKDERNQKFLETGLVDEAGRFKSLFDWSNIPKKIENQDANDRFRTSLFDSLLEVIRDSYAFMPYQFYKACEDLLEHDKCFSTDGHFDCYKLKEGMTIKVSAN